MFTRPRRLLRSIRQPEYTGENRCLPCTAVNLVLAAVGSALIGIVSPELTVVFFALSVGFIYIRGYLVPGTPTLTERYLPDRVLRWFDKDPEPAYTVQYDGGEKLDTETVLVGAGALEEDGGDFQLTPSFREVWHREIDDLDEAAAERQLARILDVPVPALTIEEKVRSITAKVDDVQLGRWESTGALVADMAAMTVLEDRISDWSTLTVEQRSSLVNSLRVYLEWCPDCGGEVDLFQETVETCCRSKEVIRSECRDCETRLLQINVARIAATDG